MLPDPATQEAIRKLVESILADRATGLVELDCRQQGRQVALRLLVDKVGGVTIRDCALLNQRIGQALDQTQLLAESYTLEVSSPGLDRPLTSMRDFERAIGEELDVDVLERIQGAAHLTGKLLAVQPEAIVLITAAGTRTVPTATIRRAVKAIRW